MKEGFHNSYTGHLHLSVPTFLERSLVLVQVISLFLTEECPSSFGSDVSVLLHWAIMRLQESFVSWLLHLCFSQMISPLLRTLVSMEMAAKACG